MWTDNVGLKKISEDAPLRGKMSVNTATAKEGDINHYRCDDTRHRPHYGHRVKAKKSSR